MRIRLDRKKLFAILNKNNNSKTDKEWLLKKFKQYGVNKNDLSTLKIRMDEIPVSLAIAQAAKETGWGTSRFAQEGNALFGVRTWDPKVPQMKPQAIPNARFGVKKYLDKCQSVGDVIDILNRHPAYKDFRIERDNQIHKTYWNYEKLIPLLAPWSTNPDYGKIILARMKELKL